MTDTTQLALYEIACFHNHYLVGHNTYPFKTFRGRVLSFSNFQSHHPFIIFTDYKLHLDHKQLHNTISLELRKL